MNTKIKNYDVVGIRRYIKAKNKSGYGYNRTCAYIYHNGILVWYHYKSLDGSKKEEEYKFFPYREGFDLLAQEQDISRIVVTNVTLLFEEIERLQYYKNNNY